MPSSNGRAATKALPSREYLLSLFEDAGDTVRWKVKKGYVVNVGDEARGLLGGYLRVMIDQKVYLVHRVLYKMRTGDEPAMLDHVDGNRLNNRPENLRPTAYPSNGFNRTVQKNSGSGFKNVSFYPRTGKWYARVRVGKKSYYSPTFERIEDAVAAAAELRAKHHGEFAHE